MKPVISRMDLPSSAAATWIGRCVEEQHPTLRGRVRCALDGERRIELWLPVLQGLTVRQGDRVLLTQPGNGSEPIVVGVVDGFAERRRPTQVTAATLTLGRQEDLVVEAADGTPLLSLRDGGQGPVVRFLHGDLSLETEGSLVLSAKDIALVARQGEARLEATSDVVVRGETIQLN